MKIGMIKTKLKLPDVIDEDGQIGDLISIVTEVGDIEGIIAGKQKELELVSDVIPQEIYTGTLVGRIGGDSIVKGVIRFEFIWKNEDDFGWYATQLLPYGIIAHGRPAKLTAEGRKYLAEVAPDVIYANGQLKEEYGIRKNYRKK